MKYSATISTGLALAGFASAAPASLKARAETNVTAEAIASIAPASISCAAGNTQCRTNTQVVGPFNEAFEKYQLTAPGQKAAVLALTAFESLDYAYKKNLNPENHGQGTSNMQMYTFNREYAESIPELKDQLATIGGDAYSVTADQKDAVLNLVMDDNYNFGSGAWYLTTKCPDVVTALASGSDLDTAFTNYMVTCVGTTMTDARQAYWTRAKTAFGL